MANNNVTGDALARALGAPASPNASAASHDASSDAAAASRTAANNGATPSSGGAPSTSSEAAATPPNDVSTTTKTRQEAYAEAAPPRPTTPQPTLQPTLPPSPQPIIQEVEFPDIGTVTLTILTSAPDLKTATLSLNAEIAAQNAVSAAPAATNQELEAALTPQETTALTLEDASAAPGITGATIELKSALCEDSPQELELIPVAAAAPQPQPNSPALPPAAAPSAAAVLPQAAPAAKPGATPEVAPVAPAAAPAPVPAAPAALGATAKLETTAQLKTSAKPETTAEPVPAQAAVDAKAAPLGADTATQISAFEQILERFEHNTLTQRDKGTAFELFVREILLKAQPWCEQFSQIQTYAAWVQAYPTMIHSDQRDTGIDLVATNRSDNTTAKPTFTAIQCKFYGRNHYIAKSQVDSFLAASEPECFTRRLFVYTGRLSVHAHNEHYNRTKHIETINRTQLEELNLDWESYLNSGQLIITKRQLRPYQQAACADVLEGFKHHNRGKLIMACGTGKTLTALKIAEAQTQGHGLILFLVPSLALLAQTLFEWKRQANVPLEAFAVCSDNKVGKMGASEDDFACYLRPAELNYPATTDARKLAYASLQAIARQNASPERGITVIFSTYQSLRIVHQAQSSYQLPDFDLIICDEAHRTAGGYLFSDWAKYHRHEPELAAHLAEDESTFTRIHNDDYIHGAKRLYMTATPKVYGESAKQQEVAGEVLLYSMDDESVFGPVFHTLNFDRAIKLGCLVDYKVIILVGDKSLLPNEQLQDFSQNNVAKAIGTWKALNKFGVAAELSADAQPMRRAVGFAQVIDSHNKYGKAGSKQFSRYFNRAIEHYRDHITKLSLNNPEGRASEEFAYLSEHNLRCECRHIDSSMDALDKDQLLEWLRAEPEHDQCKILFNVRCLSEGVDVPALDAVIFLSPRRSQVDVVQTVGRVMRTAPGKTRGYVIIPVVTNDLTHPESIFDQNQSFDVVWQVLNALKSINPDHVLVDGSTKKLDSRIEIICLHKRLIASKSSDNRYLIPFHEPYHDLEPEPQTIFDLEQCIRVEETIRSAIIKKLGSRKEWQDWAEDVATICTDQVQAIKQLLKTKADPAFQDAFAQQCRDLNHSIGQCLAQDEIIEMLAQHIVIKPVLDELFRGFPFTQYNPIARGLSGMLEMLDAAGLTKANLELQAFYQSLEFRMHNVTTLADRQTVIIDLFDRFFKIAFPKAQEKLGIVYTPIEVVDFINHSVNDLLQRKFGVRLGSSGVHILDPFTGTGTFITRMMQSPDLIAPEELAHKYRHELHAQEIVPLAYYVASINIEAVYHELSHKDARAYEPNRIVVLTDTFAEQDESSHTITGSFGANSQLRAAVRNLPIQVIIGNPPYSMGQESQNDANPNTVYPALEQRLAQTYVAQGLKVGSKKSLYDAYIKAFRWASDRLGQQGIIAFVSNAGWLDSAGASGMRACLAQEFSSIYVYHLKGNQRSSGEQARKEGGKIFGSGSRAAIAITILVKKPQAQEQGQPQGQPQGQIFFAAVDDYLSRAQKLNTLKSLGSIVNADLKVLQPDAHYDWLNQRCADFNQYLPMGIKSSAQLDPAKPKLALFTLSTLGIASGRDAWSYNSSPSTIEHNLTSTIACYNQQVAAYQADPEHFERLNDPTKLKWNSTLLRQLNKGKLAQDFSRRYLRAALYRPFCPQWLYADPMWLERSYQVQQLFPCAEAQNLVICVVSRVGKAFSCLMSDRTCDLSLLKYGTMGFPRYLYRPVATKPQPVPALHAMLMPHESYAPTVSTAPTAATAPTASTAPTANEPQVPGYQRIDAISPEAVAYFQAAYPAQAQLIDADAVFYYCYGLLHSPDYRSRYDSNLQKELPRIPRVASWHDFQCFAQAGRQLAHLHVNYDQLPPYEGCTLQYAHKTCAETMDYRVTQLKYGKIKGRGVDSTSKKASTDKSVIVYNDDLTISNIPLEAQEYVVGEQSPLDWVVERWGVSVNKESRIINDKNHYAHEHGDERYILKLILRVITLSLETVKIIKALPPLTIHPLDQGAHGDQEDQRGRVDKGAS